MRAFLGALVPVLVFLVILAALVGISVGIGWVLTLILPFSLFEGTLLGILVGALAAAGTHEFFSLPPPYAPDDLDPYGEGIPVDRFYDEEEDKTWENWFRWNFADVIYEDLLTSPRWIQSMSAPELQELAIELADAAVAALKKKSPRAERMRLGYGALKQEMDRPDRPSYDEDLLDLVVLAVNLELGPFEDVLRTVISNRLWNKPTDETW